MHKSSVITVEDMFSKYENLMTEEDLKLETFLQALTEIVRNEKTEELAWFKNIQRHNFLLKELENVRQLHDDVKLNIDKRFDNVLVKYLDRLNKEQFFVLSIENGGILKIKEHSLPNVNVLAGEFSSVEVAVQTFKDCLNELSDYLETMADIDALCWVIDPVNPTSKDNYRRIIIGDDISAIVTVDEFGNRHAPEIKLLGPSRLTEPKTEAMYQEVWDPDQMFSANLLRMLGLDHFPLKSDLKETLAKELMEELECSICLAGRNITGDLPSVICEKSTCRQQFHSDCLYQWLSAIYPAVSSNVQRFNIMYGECPSCNMPITCPIP